MIEDTKGRPVTREMVIELLEIGPSITGWCPPVMFVGL
jgi:hypothetical protein